MGDKEYDNNNQGALFKNDKKNNAKQPHYTGSAEINKVEYWVSAWIKTARSGQKYMSMAYTPKEEPALQVEDDIDDDIPF